MPGATPAPQVPAAQDSLESNYDEGFTDVTVGMPPGKSTTSYGGTYGPLSNRFAGQGGEYQSSGGRAGLPITKSVIDMTNEFYGWSDKQKSDFRNRLALLDKSALTATDKQLVSAWQDYVQQSADYFAQGKTLTPMDVLAKDIAVKSEGGLGPTTKTTKTVDTTLTSRVDSDAIFKSAAQSLLGRAPTAEEFQSFYSNLNAQERANPTTATTTTTTNAEGDVTNSSRVSEGGIGSGGAQLTAQRQAEQNPEYGAYQAATTYMDALMQTIMRGY